MSLLRRSPCARVSEITPHLICVLCGGYYIDATTIIECLHSFCKTCIVRYLETSKYCPICDVQVHKTRPLLNIRPDKTLQDLVYKLIPGLFTNEMKQRQEFYHKHPEGGQPGNVELLAEKELYAPDQTISVVLEFSPKAQQNEYLLIRSKGNIVPSVCQPCDSRCHGSCCCHGDSGRMVKERASRAGKRTSRRLSGLPEAGVGLEKRYLQCPAVMTIGHIKKFVRMKFNLSSLYTIDIFCYRDSLNENYGLLDVAYIYSWNGQKPLRLFYTVFEDPVLSAKRARLEAQADKNKSQKPTVGNQPLRPSQDGPLPTSTAAQAAAKSAAATASKPIAVTAGRPASIPSGSSHLTAKQKASMDAPSRAPAGLTGNVKKNTPTSGASAPPAPSSKDSNVNNSKAKSSKSNNSMASKKPAAPSASVSKKDTPQVPRQTKPSNNQSVINTASATTATQVKSFTLKVPNPGGHAGRPDLGSGSPQNAKGPNQKKAAPAGHKAAPISSPEKLRPSPALARAAQAIHVQTPLSAPATTGIQAQTVQGSSSVSSAAVKPGAARPEQTRPVSLKLPVNSIQKASPVRPLLAKPLTFKPKPPTPVKPNGEVTSPAVGSPTAASPLRSPGTSGVHGGLPQMVPPPSHSATDKSPVAARHTTEMQTQTERKQGNSQSGDQDAPLDLHRPKVLSVS